MKEIGKLILITIFAAIALVALVGCDHEYREIPPGYIGKVLTPTGWDTKIIEAGQVNLGQPDAEGRYNVLVLVEATSTTVKEQFMGKENSPDKEDHRILSKTGTPLAVDLYVRMMLPDEEDPARNNIFVLVTPKQIGNDIRVKVITLEDIYNRFAQMDVRGNVRGIFASYEDYKRVYESYNEINTKIAAMVLETFKLNSVPLKLQNAQLSNVKPDEQLWAAENRKAAATAEAQAIGTIGQAMKANPEYGEYLKWQGLRNIAEVGSRSGTNTLIITNGSSGNDSTWAAAEYLRQQLQTKQPETTKSPEEKPVE